MKVVPNLMPDAHVSASARLVTNGFTLGKHYEVVGRQGRLFVVRNDNGDVVLLDDSFHFRVAQRRKERQMANKVSEAIEKALNDTSARIFYKGTFYGGLKELPEKGAVSYVRQILRELGPAEADGDE
jgi:hypothetical protein